MHLFKTIPLFYFFVDLVLEVVALVDALADAFAGVTGVAGGAGAASASFFT